ncbi:hypothetical protein XACJJ10_1090030 [Xanthomonas citri pv. citri]|nr:hypothetical protein XACJJ10_1090030 [Xanthomonas citri pv. citri]
MYLLSVCRRRDCEHQENRQSYVHANPL